MSNGLVKASLQIGFLLVTIVNYSAPGRRQADQSGSVGRLIEPAAATFKYRFENRRFYISVIEIDVTPEASGVLQFKRGETEDILERKFKVSPRTLSRLLHLIQRLNFLESSEDYQNKRDFSHLGWTTITVRQGELERTVRFNYTTSPEMSEVSDILRGLSTQHINLFDIELSVEHQPLDLPRLLEVLENDLRLERMAEPEQLLPALREIANDDTLPLIARNHAGRIVTSIQKGKYKSAVKSDK